MGWVSADSLREGGGDCCASQTDQPLRHCGPSFPATALNSHPSIAGSFFHPTSTFAKGSDQKGPYSSAFLKLRFVSGDAKEHKTKSLPHCVFIHGWPEGTTGEAVQEVFPVGSAVRMLNKGKWAAVSLPTAAAAEEFVGANVTEALKRGLRLKINGVLR